MEKVNSLSCSWFFFFFWNCAEFLSIKLMAFTSWMLGSFTSLLAWFHISFYLELSRNVSEYLFIFDGIYIFHLENSSGKAWNMHTGSPGDWSVRLIFQVWQCSMTLRQHCQGFQNAHTDWTSLDSPLCSTCEGAEDNYSSLKAFDRCAEESLKCTPGCCVSHRNKARKCSYPSWVSPPGR